MNIVGNQVKLSKNENINKIMQSLNIASDIDKFEIRVLENCIIPSNSTLNVKVNSNWNQCCQPF